MQDLGHFVAILAFEYFRVERFAGEAVDPLDVVVCDTLFEDLGADKAGGACEEDFHGLCQRFDWWWRRLWVMWKRCPTPKQLGAPEGEVESLEWSSSCIPKMTRRPYPDITRCERCHIYAGLAFDSKTRNCSQDVLPNGRWK